MRRFIARVHPGPAGVASGASWIQWTTLTRAHFCPSFPFREKEMSATFICLLLLRTYDNSTDFFFGYFPNAKSCYPRLPDMQPMHAYPLLRVEQSRSFRSVVLTNKQGLVPSATTFVCRARHGAESASAGPIYVDVLRTCHLPLCVRA
jgi:hypothetical protein